MNRILISMLSLFVASATMTAGAASINVDGFTYTTSGTSAKVTAGPKTGDVVIPATVTYNGTTYNVTEIYSNAFKGAAITSVFIPDKCTKIGTSSFQNCKSLVSVTFGEAPTLKTIGSNSFSGCSALTTITLPATVTTLGTPGFADCTSLTQFTIPDGVSLATGSPLKGCTSLKSITLGVKMMSFQRSNTCPNSPLEEINVVPGAKYLSSSDGVLYSLDGKTLEEYPVAKPGTVFTIPDGVTKVKAYFNEATLLKSVVFNDMVTSISGNSFQKCPNLESITVGAKVSNIGTNCFKDSPKFKEIIVSPENANYKFADWTLFDKESTVIYLHLPQAPGTTYTAPATVETIEYGAFANNLALTSVVLGDKVKTIGSRAFDSCSALTSCSVPKSATSVGSYAFNKCKKLKDIVLPDSLIELGEGAFYNCSGLTAINIPEKLTKIEDAVFYCTSLINVIVPDSVKEIGAEAFYSISGLQTVVIGAGVTKIGASAFYDDYEESKPAVTFKPTVPPTLENQAFNDGTLMLVPAVSLEAYKAAPGYSKMDVRPQSDKDSFDVTLTAAGTLKDFVPENELNGVKSLSVQGDINGEDFEWINRMPLLAEIDLNKANIVKGGSAIITEPNVLPSFAFNANLKLKSIKLPSTITEIADSALCAPDLIAGDMVLETVDIPSTVTKIGVSAFNNRLALTNVAIPSSLKKLGESAFYFCGEIVSVNLPGSLDTIPEYAFCGCDKLTDIKIGEGVKALEYMCFSEKGLEEIVLPNSIDSIGGAFMNCKNLRKVTLPSNLKTISTYGFGFCESLEEVDIP